MGVSLTDENDYVLYRFVPEETSRYQFYSYDADGDPKAGLYDESKELIITSDDADGPNFIITETFTQGETYYFQAGMFQGETCSSCSYKISLIQTDLECEPVGETDLYVSPDEEVTLKVSASSSSEISYQWYSGGYSTLIEGADSSSYTFTADKSESYTCVVSDESGSSDAVTFYVQIENHLNAYTVDENGDTASSIDIYAEPNKPVNLTVTVEADDISQLTYEWYKDEELIEGADSKEYTTDPITKYTIYQFSVADQYGNSVHVGFSIYAENHLSAYPEGEEEEEVDNKDIYAKAGTAATLKAIVSAQDMSQLVYKWFDSDDQLIEGQNSTTLTTDPVEKPTSYRFQVEDQYSNVADVYFYVYVENNLKAYTEDEDGDPVEEIFIPVEPNDSADLNVIVTADDTSQLTYEWYKEGELIEGADSEEYTTDPITEKMSYSFRVSDQYDNSA